MKVVIQRSKNSKVIVNNKVVGEIDFGLVLLVGFTDGDNSKIIDEMIDKIINLRIFDDENKVMNKSLIDVNGQILSVSQFTLYANCEKGRRPSYIEALNSNEAIKLYEEFNNKLRNKKITVAEGIFGADMEVKITNDGPVTIILEKEVKKWIQK